MNEKESLEYSKKVKKYQSNVKKKSFVQGVISIKNLKHPEKYVGKYQDNIAVRSSWELSYIKYLDENSDIKKWWSEETVIIYKGLNGRSHRYFIDFTFWIDRKDGKEQEVWIEIKPHFQTIKPILRESMSNKIKQNALLTFSTNQLKWNAARREAIRKHTKFLILTEKDLFYQKGIK